MHLLDRFQKELQEATYSKKAKKGNFRVLKPKNQNSGDNSDSGDGQDGDQNSDQGSESGEQQGDQGKKQGQQDDSGNNSSGSKGGKQKDGKQSGDSGEQSSGSGDKQKGGQQDGISGQPTGEGDPSGGKKKKVTFKDGQAHVDGKPIGPKMADSHEEMGGGSVGDFDDIIRKVYDEVKERQEAQGSEAGEGKGGTMAKVEEYLKPKFNIKPVLKRLDDFKRLLGKQMTESGYESYSASQHNPASQRGDMMRPMKIPGGKKRANIKESAVLIFCPDTSGSITNQDYQFIFGFLKKIANHFEKPLTIRNDNGEKVGTMSGEIYLLEWDDGVHLPMRKWTQVSRGKVVKNVTKKKEEEAAENKLRGGGGTNINKLFTTLDKIFYREIKGKPYFDLDETSDYINMSRDTEDADDKSKQKDAKRFRAPLKKQKKTSMKEISKERIEQDVDLTPGEPNFMEGKKKFANVPFLIIYTDGMFAPANYTSSKLYADNPGNILYILTQKSGLANLRPVNVMFHDINNQDFSFKRIAKDNE